MTANLTSAPTGASSAETTEPLSGTPSSSAANPSTSDTWDFTPSEKTDSQPTKNSPNEVETQVGILLAFAAKLGKMVEWRKIELGDGREVFALCFPLSTWKVDDVSKKLMPR